MADSLAGKTAIMCGAGAKHVRAVVDDIASKTRSISSPALRGTPRLADVTEVATFLASDRAAGMPAPWST